MSSFDTIPQVLDTGKRVVRTVVQVALSFGTFAAVYVAVVGIIGHTAALNDSNASAWLAASATWVTSFAAVLAKIMANPTVNGWLTSIGLAGHSGEQVAGDTWTTLVQTQTPAGH